MSPLGIKTLQCSAVLLLPLSLPGWWGSQVCGDVEISQVESAMQSIYARKELPPGWIACVSNSRPESSQPCLLARLTVPLDRLLPPCMQWPSCKYNRPKNKNGCTRVVLRGVNAGTAYGDGPHPQGNESGPKTQ